MTSYVYELLYNKTIVKKKKPMNMVYIYTHTQINMHMSACSVGYVV